jgi:hypothetical protein
MGKLYYSSPAKPFQPCTNNNKKQLTTLIKLMTTDRTVQALLGACNKPMTMTMMI